MLIYAFYPNGLIEQWGTTSTDSNGGSTFNLLISFSNKNYITIASIGYSSNPDPIGYNLNYKTQSSIRLGLDMDVIQSDVPMQYKMSGY